MRPYARKQKRKQGAGAPKIKMTPTEQQRIPAPTPQVVHTQRHNEDVFSTRTTQFTSVRRANSMVSR